MTQEEKAKAYDEALEKAKQFHNGELFAECNGNLVEYIFPELCEPEDEKIRKAIHIYLDWLEGRKDYAPKGKYSIKDMIAWLEKQGGKNPIVIIPKFKVGDQIEYVGERKEFDEDKHTIKSICDGIYITTFDKKIPFTFQDNYRLIEETPSNIDIDKMVEEWKRSTRFYGTSDILAYRQGLNDAISKVVFNPAWLEKQGNKESWNEDDEEMFDEIINNLHNYIFKSDNTYSYINCDKHITWLKSLKQRITD